MYRPLHANSQEISQEVERILRGESKLVTREEFTKLEKRMVALESYVFTGKAKVKK